MLTKSEIREICLEKTRKITGKPQRSFALKEELLPLLSRYNHIALFASLDTEIDTIPLLEELLKLGKHIYLPRTEKDVIVFYPLSSLKELEISKDKYGVRQPRKGTPVDPSLLQIIICPGVAFDKRNNRLGHGKGYYDKYLVNCSAYKIGICYREQLLDEIPVSDKDIKMDKVLFF